MKQKSYEERFLIQIGKIIRELRELNYSTQEKVAEMICDRKTLSLIENGSQKTPNIIVLGKIASKLGIDLETLIEQSENKVNDFSKKIKKQIYTAISIGKFDSAINLSEKFIKPSRTVEEFKYYHYVKGAIAFYNKDYILARKHFMLGMKDIDLDKNVASFPDVLLINGYFSLCCALRDDTNKNFSKLFDIFIESVDYYMLYDLKFMIRLKIYIVDVLRLFYEYSRADRILNEAEEIIEENNFLELKIELNLIKILLYDDLSKPIQAKEIINKVRLFLKVNELKELEIYFEDKLDNILNNKGRLTIKDKIA